MNLLTKLLLLTLTTILITLIIFTLLTPLNILRVTLLTKLKNVTYNTNITITLQHEVLRGAKKWYIEQNQLVTQASHLRGMMQLLFIYANV